MTRVYIWFEESSTFGSAMYDRIRDGWERMRVAAQDLVTRISWTEHGVTLKYPVQWIHLLRPGCVRPDQSAEQVARPEGAEPNAVAARRPAHAGHEDYG